MGKYFGTDGYRGTVGEELNADNAYRIGRFLGAYLTKGGERRGRVTIGRDTRRSGRMLECALVAGLCASGADAYLLGITTTPCVAYVTRRDDFDFGVMITASHNPFYDNGIKLFNAEGEKMEDAVIEEIERYLDEKGRASHVEDTDPPYATGEAVGTVFSYEVGTREYTEYLISQCGVRLDGVRIALDCANGSTYKIAREVFVSLGAEVDVIGDSPDGQNINRGIGSTHIETLVAFVGEKHSDVAFAFDGDGDRCLAVDEEGSIVNGDSILYILAEGMHAAGTLYRNTVVTTVLSNLGLYQALTRCGILYEVTAVGDRFVYENMKKNGFLLGGEQSGHIILSDCATTGDGILTALKIMERIVITGYPLSRLARAVTMLPQRLESVRVADKAQARENSAVARAVQRVSQRLQGVGRVLVRESGTEPVLRVMVEAPTRELCAECVEEIVSVMDGEGLILNV